MKFVEVMHFIIILIVLIVVLLSLSSSSSSWFWWLHVYIYTHIICTYICICYIYMHVCNYVYTFILHILATSSRWDSNMAEPDLSLVEAHLQWNHWKDGGNPCRVSTGYYRIPGYLDTYQFVRIQCLIVLRIYLSVWCRMDASRVSSSFFLGWQTFRGPNGRGDGKRDFSYPRLWGDFLTMYSWCFFKLLKRQHFHRPWTSLDINISPLRFWDLAVPQDLSGSPSLNTPLDDDTTDAALGISVDRRFVSDSCCMMWQDFSIFDIFHFHVAWWKSWRCMISAHFHVASTPMAQGEFDAPNRANRREPKKRLETFRAFFAELAMKVNHIPVVYVGWLW